MHLLNHLSTKDLRGDFFGGLTAAVVALPLALAFGVASGAGAIAGLYGAVAVGFFAALFGGTPAQVSGPTGPMTVVFATIVALHADNLAEAFAIVIMGGALQIAFGLAHLGRYIKYTPASVVSGFMTGIGLIIILLQVAPLLGAPSADSPVGALAKLPRLAGEMVVDAALVGGLALGVMLFWPQVLRRYVPSPLAALALSTMAAVWLFPGAQRIGAIPEGLPGLVIPIIPLTEIPGMLSAAFTLALLGAIDSLLTSLVADSMSPVHHDSDRELVGQGIGNVVAGLVGGLPGAGATMRTVVNIRSGGASGFSGMMHALVLLGIALGLGRLAAQIPLAALAGILLKVGWDIIDWGFLKRIHRAPREKAIVMLLTLALTVGVDLITAVAVGLIAAGFVNARQRESEELARITHLHENGEDLSEEERAALAAAKRPLRITRLTGSFSFASAREMQRRLAVPQNALVLDLTGLGHADLSAALAIEEIVNSAQAHGQDVYVAMHDEAATFLGKMGVLDKLPPDRRYHKRIEAITAAGVG